MQTALPLNMNHLVFRKTSFGDTAIAAYTDFELASVHAAVASKQAAQAFERVKDGRLQDFGSAREAVPYDPTLQLDASLSGYEVVSVPVIDGVRALTEDGLLPWHPASKAPAGSVDSGMQAAWAKALGSRK